MRVSNFLMRIIIPLFLLACAVPFIVHGIKDNPQQEPDRIAITQEECLELFGCTSGACRDSVWQDREIYYIENEPIIPYPECGSYRLPMMTNQPWIWTPCFYQSIRGLMSCGDAEQYTLSVYFDPNFDWVNCQTKVGAGS